METGSESKRKPFTRVLWRVRESKLLDVIFEIAQFAQPRIILQSWREE